MAATAKTTARHLHLVRAAQVAGEAFACAASEDAVRARRLAGFAAAPAIWLAAGLVAAAALAFAF